MIGWLGRRHAEAVRVRPPMSALAAGRWLLLRSSAPAYLGPRCPAVAILVSAQSSASRYESAEC